MDYSGLEKQALEMMQRTDFKNLSKNDVVSIVSQLNQLQPDVAKDIIAQFPEFSNLVRHSMTEYKEELEKIIASDDESIKQVYSTAEKVLDSDAQSRTQYYDLAGKIQADLSKCLDNPNLTAEERREIFDRQMEILKAADQKDTEIRNDEKEMAQMVEKKDFEKRQFNWGIIKAASTVAMMGIAFGLGMLGGKIELKLPKKS